MEDIAENTCELCKITYASETELKDHVWSLMHHIKIEQKKKGVVHNCSLCYTTCENLIAYGKHLNEDKHKRCVAESRRAKDEKAGETIFDQLTQAEKFGREDLDVTAMEVESVPHQFRKPDVRKVTKHGGRRKGPNFNDTRGQSNIKHQRSFSQPELYSANGQDRTSSKNKKKKKKHYQTQEYFDADFQYGNRDGYNHEFHGFSDEFMSDGYMPGPNRYDPSAQHDRQFVPQPHSLQPLNWHDDEYLGNDMYTPFDNNAAFQHESDGYHHHRGRDRGHHLSQRSQSWDRLYTGRNSPSLNVYGAVNEHRKGFERNSERGVNCRGRNEGRRYSKPHYWDNQDSLDRGRKWTGTHPIQNDVSPSRSTDSNSSENSGGLKRRRAMEDIGTVAGKSRKSDKNGGIDYTSLEQGKTAEEVKDCDTAAELGPFDSDIHPISLSSERLEQSLQDRAVPRREARRVVSPPPTRSRTAKQVTWAPDTIPCRDTDSNNLPEPGLSKTESRLTAPTKEALLPTPGIVEGETSSRSRSSLKNHWFTPRSCSVDSARKPVESKHKDMLEKQSKKKTDKTTSVVRTRRNYTHDTQQDLTLGSRARDKGESVLEKAEKLCKKLREEREQGKREKEKKEHQKKIERQMELTSQIKALSEKNKENIKGHLQKVESALDSALSSSGGRGSPSVQLREPKTSNRSQTSTPTVSEDCTRLSNSMSSIGAKPSIKQSEKLSDLRSEIDKIRENIERSVNKEKNETVSALSKSDSVLPHHKFVSPLAKRRLQKSEKQGYDKDSLLKMINSPRNRKEQVHLAQMLRNYAERKSKLSLPRFNLHSDLVEKPEELEMELVNLSPDVQLEIAKFMEADVKPDLAELEKMLEERCTGEIDFNFDDLVDNGTQQTFADTPAVTGAPSSMTDIPPSLSIDDLTSEVRKTKDDLLNLRQLSASPTPRPKPPSSEATADVVPGLPPSSSAVSSVTPPSSSVVSNHLPVIKQEKPDSLNEPYGQPFQPELYSNHCFPGESRSHVTSAVPSATTGVQGARIGASYSSRAGDSSKDQGSFLEETPVRDTSGLKQADRKTNSKSTLEQVNAILEATPNMEDVLKRTEPSVPSATVMDRQTPPIPPAQQPTNGPFESSQGSISSGQSVLDAVYDISLKEENIRQELSTVDVKITKLRQLMAEASEQLKKFSEKKETLRKEEGEMRTKRIQLLQESRSLQGSSSSHTESPGPLLPPQLSNLTESQLQNLNNPVFLKFLMSQKQSDMSSVGGFSMVESGSQADPERDMGQIPTRRGSVTSDISTVSHDQPAKQTPSSQESAKYLTHSVDLLTGSAESVISEPQESQPTNSKGADGMSLLAPLEKTGFITLDSLMNDNSDLGKLLQKSLEDVCSMSPGTPERVRRNSMLSVGSDDLLQSGSDVEKRSGKISMKFMGTLPNGIDSGTLMKQLSTNSKSPKAISYTVISSPEAVSQLKKLSDSGLGTTSTTHNTDSNRNTIESDNRSETSTKTITTLNDFEVQSVKSGYSLGEEIKNRCAGQNPDESDTEGSKTLEEDPGDSPVVMGSPAKNLRSSKTKEKSSPSKKNGEMRQARNNQMDSPSSVILSSRKKLKSKKERDKKSRRKQKEDFILETSSDGNSFEDELSTFLRQKLPKQQTAEEDMVQTGSEDLNQPANQTDVRKRGSLLEKVQLESPSDSTDDRDGIRTRSGRSLESLKLKPAVLESFRAAVKTKLPAPTKASIPAVPTVKYKGPEVAVAAMQVFKGDLYICYNGSELRRFNLKTGEVLKELDCSPYLVQCLHITTIEEREDILFTGGACKKLMLFKPQKFNIIQTYDYDERIMCLHENWGRLFVGLSDGVISVRSLKTDKELNTFQCTDSSVVCMTSANAGMTKLICCGTADKIIYILDAASGLLITMLEGHRLTPLCMQVRGELMVSGSADKFMLVHNVRTGTLEKTVSDHKAMISDLHWDRDTVYSGCYDKFVRCFSTDDFKCKKVYYGAGRNMLTCLLVHEDKVLSGNREGLVEAVPLVSEDRVHTCECDECDLHFGIQEHLLHHVMTDHILPNSRMVHCPWQGCKEWLSTQEGNSNAEEHLITKHLS